MESQGNVQRNEAPANGAQTRTVDENAPIDSLARLEKAMVTWAPRLESLAPPGRAFDFSRFKEIVLSCAARTPKVLLCSVYSIKQSVKASVELGFELGGVSGEAYLIPYENRKKIVLANGREEWIKVLEAQFMPGYKGFLRLARESGLFRDIDAAPILPDDVWEPIRRGPEKLLWGHIQNEPAKHAPIEIDAERWEKGNAILYKAKIKPIRGAYAYAKLVEREADDIVKPIWFDRLEEIRLRSKAGKNGPWISDYAEMAQKTAIRNLWKYLPKNKAMARAEELDQEFDFDDVVKDGRTSQPSGEGKGDERASEPKVDPARAKTSKVAEDLAKRNAAARGEQAPPAPPASEPTREEEAPPASGEGR